MLCPASATIRREGLQSADLLSCLTGRAVQADGGQVQCGAVLLNGDTAHCQHLGRPLHGADAELERHAVNFDGDTPVSCRWRLPLPYEDSQIKIKVISCWGKVG